MQVPVAVTPLSELPYLLGSEDARVDVVRDNAQMEITTTKARATYIKRIKDF
jgi:hypothetical protein